MGKNVQAKKDQLPAELMNQMQEHAGEGFEKAQADSYAIPFLAILQKNSPQVDSSDGAYIDGAKPGLIFDTIEGRLYESVTVVPCHYATAFVQWHDRDKGGGFVAEYDRIPEGANRDDRGRFVIPGTDGDYVNDTRKHYVLILDEDGARPALISMTSTQIKKSRRWMTVMNTRKMTGSDGKVFRPPMWAHSYRLSTVKEENKKGTWFGWKVEPASVVNEEIFLEGKALRDAVVAGQVKEAPPQAPDDEEAGQGDVPF